MDRKKWLSLYYSIVWFYIYQTCSNCSSWYNLLVPHGGLCPLPTFHAWVTIVRKKWLGLYYSTYWCYIHQTCTNSSSWHGLLVPHGGLCPWTTFHAWVTMVRKKYITVSMSATFTKLTPTVYLDMIYGCHMMICVLDLHFTLHWPGHKMAIASPLMMVPIITMSGSI